MAFFSTAVIVIAKQATMKKILLLIFLPLKIFSQDFTGIWTGFIYTAGNQLPYELVIGETNGKLAGYSMTIFTIDGMENTGVKLMKVKSRKGDLTIEDDDLIYNNYTTLAKAVTLFSTLNLEKEDSVMVLKGSFFTRSVDRSSFKGTIRLQKKNSYPATKLVAQLKRMNLLNSLSFRQNKEIENNKDAVAATVKKNESLPGDSSIKKEEMLITAIKKERSLQPVSEMFKKRKYQQLQICPL